MKEIVVTVIGPDRPGLVGSVARVVNDLGGNWIESRMAHLGGQFAGMLKIEVDDGGADRLVVALNGLPSDGLQVTVAAGDTPSAGAGAGARTLSMELIGQDRPGIVAQISRTLAAKGVNVEELETCCESAPWSGEILFKATAKLSIPGDVQTADLRAELESVASDLMVDLTFDEEAQG